MASRNNGEDPPDGKGGSGRPGSYVKIAGSRRRRRGRKHGPSVPPGARTALAEPLDPSDGPAGEASGESRLDEPFEPPVDDLRGRGSGGPRRSPGPLGLDDMREGGISGAPAEGGPQHVRVVEINAPRGSANSNDPALADDDAEARRAAAEARLASASPQDALRAEATSEGDPRAAHEPADDRAWDEGHGEQDEAHGAHGSESDWPVPPRELPPDRERVPAARLLSQPPFGAFELEGHDAHPDAPPHGVSSVFNARPSLRPSPPPPPRSALGWWLAVLVLSGIIAAAGVVAWKEHEAALLEAQEEAGRPPPAERSPPEQPAQVADAPPPAPEPAVEAPAPAAVSDAGAATSVKPAPKPVRVWKPRPKAQLADAGVKRVDGDAAASSAPVLTPVPVPAPTEIIPANPYGGPAETR